jgi:hypothetical protein
MPRFAVFLLLIAFISTASAFNAPVRDSRSECCWRSLALAGLVRGAARQRRDYLSRFVPGAAGLFLVGL